MLTEPRSVRNLVLTAGIALAASSPALHAADISPLTTKAAAAAKAGDAAGSIDALEQALAQQRLEAPISLKPFVVVARPAKFYGDYEARADAAYGKGEKVYFYVEPKNLVYPKSASGIYEPAFEVDIEIKAPDGQSMKQPRFAIFRLPTRSRIQDIYLNLTLSLSDMPLGKYNVRFVVRDLNSKKTATVDQPITLKWG